MWTVLQGSFCRSGLQSPDLITARCVEIDQRSKSEECDDSYFGAHGQRSGLFKQL